MDFSLNEAQRAWQLKARNSRPGRSAPCPCSATRSATRAQRSTGNHQEGFELGFRTAGVPASGRGGLDFVTQGAGDNGARKGRQRHRKTFSQCWKWSHLIADRGNAEQWRAFPEAVPRGRNIRAGWRHYRAEWGRSDTACS